MSCGKNNLDAIERVSAEYKRRLDDDLVNRGFSPSMFFENSQVGLVSIGLGWKEGSENHRITFNYDSCHNSVSGRSEPKLAVYGGKYLELCNGIMLEIYGRTPENLESFLILGIEYARQASRVRE